MIDLKQAYGGNSGKPIGSLAWFKNPTNSDSVLTIGLNTYLRTGTISKGQSAIYPDAYSLYSAPVGEKWNKLNSATGTAVSGTIIKIAYGNGVAVAIGNNNLLMISTDGLNWVSYASTTISSTAYNWFGITYGNGLFVIVGSNAQVATSPDGLVWTLRTNTLASTYTIYDVIYAGGRFVAVATAGTTTNRVIFSTDGITWTTAVSTNFSSVSSLCSVAYGNGTYVARCSSNNNLLYSTDANNWLLFSSAVNFTTGDVRSKVIYGANGFYAVGAAASGILFSATGSSGWAALPNQPQTTYQQYIYYANGCLFSWCYNTVSLTNDLYLSKDNGTTWTLVSSTNTQASASSLFADICYSPALAQFIAIDRRALTTISVPFASFDSAVGYTVTQTLAPDVVRYMRIK